MLEFEYLKTEYESLVIDKNDLLKTLDLATKISRSNSASLECSSLSFIVDWMHKTVELVVTNDLTYLRNKVELMGELTHPLTTDFSIKLETLNKLKAYFRDKVLIYKKLDNYYIRLLDGDLLLDVKYPNKNRLAFTTVPNEMIYETNVGEFCKLLYSYRAMTDDYSDKWLSFDGERLTLCGLNFYSETKIKTPTMCFLMLDVELLIKLDRYYHDEQLRILSTDSEVPKLHVLVGNIEIEMLNVVSNINFTNINRLSSFISESSYSVPAEAFRRVMNIALSLSNINKDCTIKYTDKGIIIILNDNKGDSEFNLMTEKLNENSEVNSVKINVDTISKIINAVDEDTITLTLNKIYTTICSKNIRNIILNK